MGEAKGEVYSGKTMEKVSYTWLLQDYKKYRELGPGVALVSPAFDGPNGHKFKIKFYPGGATQRAYIAWAVSFAIETTQTAELVLSFKTVDPLISFASAQSCSFKKRGIFRRVFSVQAGHTSPSIQLSRYRLESELITGENAFKIEATIGVFINTNTNTNHPPIDRFLFFKVDDKRFFAEQSIIEERCPALLPNSSSHEPDADIVVTDIEPDIFDVYFAIISILHYFQLKLNFIIVHAGSIMVYI